MPLKKKTAPLHEDAVHGCVLVYWCGSGRSTPYAVAKPDPGLIARYQAAGHDNKSLMDCIICCHQTLHEPGDEKISRNMRRAGQKLMPGAVAAWLHEIGERFVLLIAEADGPYWSAHCVTSNANTLSEFRAWIAGQDLAALAADREHDLPTSYAAVAANAAARSARTTGVQ